MQTFRQKVLLIIGKISRGRVASYGQVAAAAGSPRAARQVGFILRGLNHAESLQIPWWRVVNNKGVLSIKGNWTATKELQAALLRKEGVIIARDFSLDMQKYRFNTLVGQRLKH